MISAFVRSDVALSFRRIQVPIRSFTTLHPIRCAHNRLLFSCNLVNPFGCVGSRTFTTILGANPTETSKTLMIRQPVLGESARWVSTKQRRKWKIRKYHFKLRLKRTMRKMRVPYVSSKARGQVKKKPILFDFRPRLRRKLKRAER